MKLQDKNLLSSLLIQSRSKVLALSMGSISFPKCLSIPDKMLGLVKFSI
jgi:hypothetical protein